MLFSSGLDSDALKEAASGLISLDGAFFFNLNKQYKTRAPFVRIAIVPSRSREIIIIIIILFTLGTSLHAFILVYTYMCTYTRTPSNFESTLLWLSETFRSFQPSSFSDCNEVGARCKTFTTLPPLSLLSSFRRFVAFSPLLGCYFFHYLFLSVIRAALAETQNRVRSETIVRTVPWKNWSLGIRYVTRFGTFQDFFFFTSSPFGCKNALTLGILRLFKITFPRELLNTGGGKFMNI